MLSGEARRAASILHQTPGWRWRRKLCLTECTQQCRSGPTTKAWFHDRCNRVDSDACRGSNVTTRARSSSRDQRETLADEATLRRVRGSTARAAWKGWRVRVAPPGRVRVAPPERDPRGSGQHCFKELGRQQSCSAKRHAASSAWGRVDGSVRASAGSTARKRHLDECG